VLLEELDPPCLSDWQPQRTDMVSATAIAASSRVVLLKAIHLSPVGQSQRMRPAPVNKSDPSMREGEMEHIPHMYYIR
jgi:hypothetical protein